MIKFSIQEKKIGKKIFEKFKKGKQKDPKWSILSFNKLFKILNKREGQLIKKILLIEPKEYGLNNKQFFGIKPIPKNLIIIKGQKIKTSKGITKEIRPQSLPKNVFFAYQSLNRAMKKEINCSLIVASGYRSPAYQAAVFFCNLYLNDWDVKKTLRSVALPGGSEHGHSKRQAIDFYPQKGIINPVRKGGLSNGVKIKDFYKTKEYRWLIKNAKKFGFYLSFPKNNKFDTIFEPWHWHFQRE